MLAAASSWDVNVEAAIPLEAAAHAAEDQVWFSNSSFSQSQPFFSILHYQAKRTERLVKERLQKQFVSVAEQQQRLNKVRVELEKLETVCTLCL